jgi:hypothetical protein
MKGLIAAVGVILIFVAARLYYLDEQGNFHSVTPGVIYRSAQLDRDEAGILF